MKPDTIVVHYDEIGLKGGNRYHFENLLIKNIHNKLGRLIGKTRKEPGQIAIELKDYKPKKIKDICSKIPGIAYFSLSKNCNPNIQDINKTVLEFIKKEKFSSFKINTKRRSKELKFNSMEVNKIVGESVREEYEKKVTMKDPDLAIKVEVTKDNAYVSLKDISGVGGLPTDKGKKVIVLLSGGIDSPVAAYSLIKRGCEVILVHFHNRNTESSSVKDKILKLAKQLSKFQQKTKLYIIPFENIQKQIIANTRSDMRMLVYRRFMIKIASSVAEKEKVPFLVVGDSLSQVASQTLQNLSATYYDSKIPIFTPLIGIHKKEIIQIARQIGTYEISKLPYGDCCSFFLAKHPELRADKEEIKKIGGKFDISSLVHESIKKGKIREF